MNCHAATPLALHGGEYHDPRRLPSRVPEGADLQRDSLNEPASASASSSARSAKLRPSSRRRCSRQGSSASRSSRSTSTRLAPLRVVAEKAACCSLAALEHSPRAGLSLLELTPAPQPH